MRLLGFAFIGCAVSAGGESTSNESANLTVPAPAWDSVFARTGGWTGGDAMYSVELGKHRTLWLFADSWIGRIADGRHVNGARLVNNTIALHPTPPPGRPPDSDALEFLWGPKDGKGFPTAWIKPAFPVTAGEAPEGNGTRAETWYWVADGRMAPAPTGGDRLLIFLWHMGRKAGAKGVWSFESVGGALAVIENPHDPVASWTIKQFANPHAIGAAQSAADTKWRQISWGSEVLLTPSPGGASGAQLYIYGVREGGGWNKQVVLARAPAERVEDFDTWRFYTGAGWSRRWQDLSSVCDGVANEFSVHRIQVKAQPIWAMIHSEPLFGPHVMCRTAPRAEGPWSKPQPIYKVPGITKNKNYFAYAAKGHDHLSAPGELLITYIINSHDFAAMVRDADIYRPRFLRLNLDRLTSVD
jgi:hypothetical protein